MIRAPKEFFIQQVEQRSTKLGQQVLDTADSLHRIAGQLRQDELASGAADLADSGAEMIERCGRYLEDSDFDQLVSDAEEFSRERPLTMAAAGLVVGLVASRMIKGSAAGRHMLDVDSALNDRGPARVGGRRSRRKTKKGA
jgi:hypothetical protein